MKTQRCFLIALALFGGAILSVAQQPTSDNSTQGPDSVPTREYSSTEGRFKILFCETPKEISEMIDSSWAKLAVHMLFCTATVTSYSVSYMDYPITLETPDLVKKAWDNAREGSLKRVAKEEAHVVSESDISIEGHPGRFLQIELKGDALVRIRYVVVGNRVYFIVLGSPKLKPKIVDVTNDYEKLAKNFFKSFKLIPPLEADRSATWKEFSSTEGGFKVQFPGTPQESSLPAGSSGNMRIAQY